MMRYSSIRILFVINEWLNYLNEFNVELELRSRLMPTIWEFTVKRGLEIWPLQFWSTVEGMAPPLWLLDYLGEKSITLAQIRKI